MHPDVHLMLHHARAEELRREAPARDSRARLGARLGWTLVELGLRLVSSSGPSRPSPGPAVSRPCPSVS
ncbi:hypothetical protein [Streptomyces sp. 135]|uniref:hypothetical protein n=1 Tax=Streptomyces sp. 135 TaxID=2838850 RepID=UPI001CBBDC9C|nr:hypothetical protein [Streptomyces sp. 135]